MSQKPTLKKTASLNLSDLAQFLETTSSETKNLLKEQTEREWGSTHVPPEVVRALLVSKGFDYPNKIISFQMLKGGVAKTTSALNIGLRAAMYGHRVLFIDLDQQANLTFALGVNAEERPVWLDVVEKKADIESCVCAIDSYVDLIPSNLNNSVLDRVLLNSNRNWSQSIISHLTKIRGNYDLIVIDTAPALSAVNTAATVASDLVIFPVNPDKFSYLGLVKHVEELQDVVQDFSLKLDYRVLLTRFDSREKLSHEIYQQCVDKFADRLMRNYIRTSSELKSRIGDSQNIFTGRSPARDDYDRVTREIWNPGVSL